jgi:hypothetical protein
MLVLVILFFFLLVVVSVLGKPTVFNGPVRMANATSNSTFLGGNLKNLEPACKTPVYLGSNVAPFSVYGRNLVYYQLSNVTFPIPTDIQSFYVWDLGADQRPNTGDDGRVSQINGSHIQYQISYEDSNIMPMINDRYLVWMDGNDTSSFIKVIDMGSNGRLEQSEINNAAIIFNDDDYSISSINLNKNILAFIYEYDALYLHSQKMVYCDLSLPGNVNKSCFGFDTNKVVVRVNVPIYSGIRFSDIFTDNTYGYDLVLWNQYINVFHGRVYTPYHFDSSTGLITQRRLSVTPGSNGETITSVSNGMVTSEYNGIVYNYLGPLSSTPFLSSSGSSDYMSSGSLSSELSPLGNYLTLYYKYNKGKWFLGTLNGVELKTPFSDVYYMPAFYSGSRGNFVYLTDYFKRFYFDECYGI